MNVAIVTEAEPRLLLQHSSPDHEVSKPSSDSHRSLTGLEHECREWRQSVYPWWMVTIDSLVPRPILLKLGLGTRLTIHTHRQH